MRKKKITSTVLALVGVALIVFGVYRSRLQKYRYSFSEVPLPAQTQHTNSDQSEENIVDEPEKKYSEPSRIVIKDLNVDLLVETSTIVDGVWEVAEESTSYLDRSAKPGEGGNIVLYGHNKRHILGILPEIRVGNVIELYDSEGNKYEYVVDDTFIVSPDDVSVVQPTDHEVLTVYTCTGPLDSKRFIVKAYPVVEEVQNTESI